MQLVLKQIDVDYNYVHVAVLVMKFSVDKFLGRFTNGTKTNVHP